MQPAQRSRHGNYEARILNLWDLAKSYLPAPKPAPGLVATSVDSLPTFIDSAWGGDKWFQSFGDTWLTDNLDYDTLRRRSIQMFRSNPYGRGIIRRIVTNEINAGLTLEATPDASILGLDEDQVADWAEDGERRFTIWGELPETCDHKQQRTFGALQQLCRETALTSGDCLVVLRQGAINLPTIEIVDGLHIETPAHTVASRNEIRDGVELDASGRHVAFWIAQDDGTHKRIAAKGRLTGRRQAWMVYGTERRPDDVRGEPILGILLHALRDTDRYKDAELRSALANALIAMWVEYDTAGVKSTPLTGTAQRKDSLTTTNAAGEQKTTPIATGLPGASIEGLPVGAKLHSHDSRRPNVNFGVFERSALSGMAWALEMPPEILMLEFQNNYSASRSALSEYKMYLDKARPMRSNEFGKPIYQEWLLSMTLLGKVVAPGLVDSWRDPAEWETWGAWVQSDWAGAIKPSVDRLKEVNAYLKQIDGGLITRDRASKELNGMKFTRVARQLVKENEQFAATLLPTQAPVELNSGSVAQAQAMASVEDIAEAVADRMAQDG